jgi:hypothetical protein
MSCICNTPSFAKSVKEMSMHATAQPLPGVSPVSIDLNPPVRAESIDLRVLIGHRTATQASASVESVAEIFKTGSANFVAVLEGQRLLGMCSRQEIAALLGGRYGFSLWARKPIRNHLCKEETRIKVATPIADVLRTCSRGPTIISTMTFCWWMKMAGSLDSSALKRFSKSKTRFC